MIISLNSFHPYIHNVFVLPPYKIKKYRYKKDCRLVKRQQIYQREAGETILYRVYGDEEVMT
jgi:hypothetical protein